MILSRVLLIYLSSRLLEIHIELYAISMYLEYFLMFIFYLLISELFLLASIDALCNYCAQKTD